MLVSYSTKFLKSASRLPKRIVELAERKEILFKSNTFHPGLETHKLHGKEKDIWAFSVDRKYRIKFLFLSSTHVLFVDIGLHDIYR